MQPGRSIVKKDDFYRKYPEKIIKKDEAKHRIYRLSLR